MKNVFIISGAAGSGKDSVIDGLQSILPIERIVTTTTREMRPFESEGHPYYFLSVESFKHGLENGEFIEHSINENGGLYGVTKSELERITHKNKIALWRVDWKGVINIKKLYPEIKALYIAAPIEILEARLRSRDTDKDEAYFQERMAYTREWLQHLDIYDYQVNNEEGKLAQTIKQVAEIIKQHSSLD
jgi:guanylate kinase